MRTMQGVLQFNKSDLFVAGIKTPEIKKRGREKKDFHQLNNTRGRIDFYWCRSWEEEVKGYVSSKKSSRCEQKQKKKPLEKLCWASSFNFWIIIPLSLFLLLGSTLCASLKFHLRNCGQSKGTNPHCSASKFTGTHVDSNNATLELELEKGENGSTAWRGNARGTD